MQFHNADIENLVSRSLVIEFFEISLTQNTDKSPNTFTGPGSISTLPDGRLSLKMYDASKTSQMPEMSRLGFYQGTGVVAEYEYYRVSAKDSHGNTWVAPRVYINDGLNITPFGTVFQFDVPSIRTERVRIRKDLEGQSIANVVVSGRFRLPFNKFEDQPDGSSSVTALEFTVEGAELELSQKANHLDVVVVSPSKKIDHEFLMVISEALSIAIGHEAWPAYYRVYHDGVLSSFVSGKADVIGLGMIQPLADTFPYKTAKFISFVDCYVNNRQKEHDHLVNYWRRLYYISSQISDVAALVLTVNIEGLISNYFSEGRVPSNVILGEIGYSKKLIRSIKLPASTNSRIKNVLGGMKKLSSSNILRELAEEGVVEGSHVKSWNDLRHSLAHAGNRESDPVAIGLFVEDIKNCLDLFYRLIGLSVGYDASRIVNSDDLISADAVRQIEYK